MRVRYVLEFDRYRVDVRTWIVFQRTLKLAYSDEAKREA